jgi:hypothetical protein
MPVKYFQIALVNKVPSKYAYFTAMTQNEITFTLWDYLARIAVVAGGFIPSPSWNLRSGQLQGFDAVIYFVQDPSSGIARRVSGATIPSGSNLGGLTVSTSKGVVCEVYVDGNLPAGRLANIAFHEFMHNRLDVGARVISNLHKFGGGGIATPPTSESSVLTLKNINLIAKNLFKPIKQYTGAM